MIKIYTKEVYKHGKKIREIYYSPDELGYKDRGIKKWQGLMLKEHNEALKKHFYNKNKDIVPEAKRVMTDTDISQILLNAYKRNQPVIMQLALLNKNGEMFPDILCMIKGQKNNEIFIELNNGKIRTCTLDEIRHVSIADSNEWFVKRPT